MASPTTTQPKRERPLLRLLSLLVLEGHTISLWLITASLLGLLALPLLDRPIRFEEKGLLAGMSHPTVGYFANADAAELDRISRSAGGAAAFQRPGAAAALAAELRSAGLADTQLTRPVVTAPGPAGGPPAPCRCTNVHTRVRAPRGDGLESLALVTPVAFSPQRPDPVHDGRNQSAEGAELALRAAAGLVLHMARGHVAAGSPGVAGGSGGGGRWLVRDLLWVVPDLSCGAHQCLEAWVRQYYGVDVPPGPTSSNSSSPPSSPASSSVARRAMFRAGVIQQAVVLEALAGASYDTHELLVVGHDGLLPKLDMFYLLRYLFNYPVGAALWRDDLVEGSQWALTNLLQGLMPQGLGLQQQSLRSYVQRLLSGLQFSWHQAVGQPAGAHAAFKDFMVDAASVRLVRRRPTSGGDGPLTASASDRDKEVELAERAVTLSYSLELTLRSLNNLVERVHHSPFLYLLTDLDTYVSVERYVAPACALAAALQLQAAWSMAAAQLALEAPATAAAAAAGAVVSVSSARIWATATARAAARTAVLAAAAAALRALACGPPSWLQGGAAPPWAVAAAASVRSILAHRLATPEGLLAVAAVLVGAGAAAVAAAGVAGRLAGAAGSGGSSEGHDRMSEHPAAGQGEEAAKTKKKAKAGASRSAAVRPAAVSQQDLATGSSAPGKESRHGGSGDGAPHDDAPGDPALRAAAVWHAERVVVLTATAAAMTTLVSLNWAAAVVTGMYMAPLALWQGWAVGSATGLPACSRRGGGGGDAREARRPTPYTQARGALLRVVWLAWNPLVYLGLISVGAAAVGFERSSSVHSGTAAGAVCALSATNFWYASVVVPSFWLFGL